VKSKYLVFEVLKMRDEKTALEAVHCHPRNAGFYKPLVLDSFFLILIL